MIHYIGVQRRRQPWWRATSRSWCRRRTACRRRTEPAPLRGGEGTVDWDTVASNRSMDNALSNLNQSNNSNKSTWEVWARWRFPTVWAPLPKCAPCHIASKGIAQWTFSDIFQWNFTLWFLACDSVPRSLFVVYVCVWFMCYVCLFVMLCVILCYCYAALFTLV